MLVILMLKVKVLVLVMVLVEIMLNFQVGGVDVGDASVVLMV